MRVIALGLPPSSTLVEKVHLDHVLEGKVIFMSDRPIIVYCPSYLTFSQHNVQVMTPNPECAIIYTPIVDALHTMHNGKFLHLPVVNRGNIK